MLHEKYPGFRRCRRPTVQHTWMIASWSSAHAPPAAFRHASGAFSAWLTSASTSSNVHLTVGNGGGCAAALAEVSVNAPFAELFAEPFAAPASQPNQIQSLKARSQMSR